MLSYAQAHEHVQRVKQPQAHCGGQAGNYHAVRNEIHGQHHHCLHIHGTIGMLGDIIGMKVVIYSQLHCIIKAIFTLRGKFHNWSFDSV